MAADCLEYWAFRLGGRGLDGRVLCADGWFRGDELSGKQLGGLVSQGLGTSMLQFPNIIRNPYIWIPPTLASVITGPVSTLVFRLQNIPLGAGMGTSGLVGPLGIVSAMP